MAYEPRKVGSLREGSYIIDPDTEEPCKILSVDHSKPGKHGAAKARMQIEGLFTGKKTSFLSTVDKRVNVPIIDKRIMQVTNITQDSVKLMDSETYEMHEEPLPENEKRLKKMKKLFEGGKAVQAEVWVVMDRKKIMSIREMEM